MPQKPQNIHIKWVNDTLVLKQYKVLPLGKLKWQCNVYIPYSLNETSNMYMRMCGHVGSSTFDSKSKGPGIQFPPLIMCKSVKQTSQIHTASDNPAVMGTCCTDLIWDQ